MVFVERHESLNFSKIGQETLNYLASNTTIFESERLPQNSNQWINYIKSLWAEGVATEAEI
ncbi:hypothetical protein CN461_29975 [Bacillus thuringiensis]|uniref:Uncharacterized protein n=1 Tax=Bacillus thuringiensis TaxID=1428 RepID=A0A9X6TGW6_BACTU|nr:hypothetical protein CON71_32135 [Bacillus thuringiensis]PEX43024.1 hypothetical protein CN461_29975 [Bacillus thuringiensis]PGO13828.1 hypothetical protein CN974_27770 [Bacillus thuringiensis]